MAQGLTLTKNKKIIIVTSLGYGTQLLILKLKRRQARREGAATGVLAPPPPPARQQRSSFSLISDLKQSEVRILFYSNLLTV